MRGRITASYPGIVVFIGLFDLVLTLALVGTLFAIIYRYLPARRLPWKVVLIGGLLTAILFEIGRWGVGWYLAHSTQPSAFGAASSFAALLLWLYYTAQIFLFGAEFTACLGELRKPQDESAQRSSSTPL